MAAKDFIPALSLVGRRFGHWTVTGITSEPRKVTALCDCGTEKELVRYTLTGGLTRSCGCQKGSLITDRITRHGHTTKHRLSGAFRSWAAMKQRCTDPKADNFARYGGAGVKVCERWLYFANFLADMGERPPGTSLDRWPNGRGDYAPGNVRWATATEQANNRTFTRGVHQSPRTQSTA